MSELPLLTGLARLRGRLSGSLVASTNQAIQTLLNVATSTPPCAPAHGCFNMSFVGATIPSLLDQARLRHTGRVYAHGPSVHAARRGLACRLDCLACHLARPFLLQRGPVWPCSSWR